VNEISLSREVLLFWASAVAAIFFFFVTRHHLNEATRSSKLGNAKDAQQRGVLAMLFAACTTLCVVAALLAGYKHFVNVFGG
jgi:hypothetical protein